MIATQTPDQPVTALPPTLPLATPKPLPAAGTQPQQTAPPIDPTSQGPSILGGAGGDPLTSAGGGTQPPTLPIAQPSGPTDLGGGSVTLPPTLPPVPATPPPALIGGTVGGGGLPTMAPDGGTPSTLPPLPIAQPAGPTDTGTQNVSPQQPTTLPLASSTTTGPGGVTLSNQDLTASTIAAPQADRGAIAQKLFDESAAASDPAYEASIRGAVSNGAALGQIGSGGLRTSVGNLALARGQQLDSLRSQFLTNAENGTIADNQFNTNQADQQQQTQIGQQGTAFNQAAQQAQIQEALTNGDFNRALELLNAGNTGNPSGTDLSLANNYGNQAASAGAAAGGLIGSSVGNANTQIPAWLLPYLSQLNGQQTAPTTPQPTLPIAPPYQTPGEG